MAPLTAAQRAFRFSTKLFAAGSAGILVHKTRKSILLESAPVGSADESNTTASFTFTASARPPTDFWTRLAGDLPRQFCAFVDASPSPHHAVDNAKALLRARGFHELREGEAWALAPGGRYFVNRNAESGSSLAAFAIGERWQPGGDGGDGGDSSGGGGGGGFAIVGTHVDSPCLRVKPISKRKAHGYAQLGVELYGGGLWHTWFDRDLGLAGRVLVRTGHDSVESRLVDVHEPILRVPSLAAHYRQHNPLKIDLERHLVPVLGSVDAETAWISGKYEGEEGTKLEDSDRAAMYPPGREHKFYPTPAVQDTQRTIVEKVSTALGVEHGQILDMDLCLYDVQPSTVGGTHDEYVFAPRIDNLMMTFCGLVGFTRSLEDPDALVDDTSVRVITLFDHEEIGSTSPLGAKSTFIPHILKRICAETVKDGVNLAASSGTSNTLFERSMAKSFFLSADMVHAVHPAHSGFHESQHHVYMNRGLVISSTPRNAFMRNSPGSYMMREITCRSADLLPRGVTPQVQLFVNPNDVSCGSTLGPLFGTVTGIRTLDVGNSQLSMHSAREMAGAYDIRNAVAILQAYFRDFVKVDESTKID